MGEEEKKSTRKIYNDAYSDQRLFAIQKSTRSRFRIFQKLNEKLRLRFRWYYNLRVDSLYLYDTPEKQMFAIQKSTRTSLRYFQPLHEKLRQMSRRYYKWHIRPESHKIHWATLGIYILAVTFGVTFSFIANPNSSKANIDFVPGTEEKMVDYSKIYKPVKSDATEVVAKRTENTKVFKNPDGTEQYIITGGPLHYKDANGKWKNIDSSILTKEDGTGFTMDKSIYLANFNKQFTANPLVQVLKDGQNLSMKPGELFLSNATADQKISNPVNSEGVGSSHQIIYKNAYGSGLDFSYETQDFQLNKKLNITSFESLPAPTIDMTSKTDANLKFQLEFGVNAGLELFIDDKPWDGSQTVIENQNLIFKKDGKTLWQLTSPKAWDSTYDSNNQSLVQRSSELAEERSWITGKATISKTGDKLNMSVLFPYSWLKTAEYPVTIDPDTYYGETTDGYIAGTNATYSTAQSTSASFGSSNLSFYIGQDGSSAFGATYGVARSYLEFNTSGIDDASTVTQANLYLTANTDSSATDFTVRVHEYAWTSPLAAGTQEADYDGALAATTNAVDWRSTSGMSSGTAYASSDLRTAYIQKGATKTKYALVSNRDIAVTTPTTAEFITIISQDNASYKPYLSIITSNNSCQSAATGNWSDPTKWTSCNGGYPEATDSVTILDTHTITLTADADITTGSITINSGGELDTGNNSLTVNNLTNNGTLVAGISNSILVAGNWTNNDTFTPSESYTIFNGGSDQTISGSATHDFFSVYVQKSGGKLILGAAVTISGSGGIFSLSITDSTINLQSYDLTISGATDAIYSTSISTPFTFIEGTGKTIILADNSIVSESANGIYNYGNVQIGDSTHSPIVSNYDAGVGGSTFKFGAFNLAAGTFSQGGYDMIATGNFTIAATGATFTKGTGTAKLKLLGDLTFTGPATPQNLGAVEIGASPDTTDLASDWASDSLTINSGDIFNTNGYEVDIGTGGISLTGTLDTTDDVETDGCNINVAGNFTVNSGGTFTKDVTSGRSKIIFDGAATKTLTSDGEDLGDIQTSTASTHIDLQDNLTMGNLLIDTSTVFDLNTASRTLTTTDIHNNGTLTATTTSSITTSGNWDSTDGTFTYSTSTLILTGATPTITATNGTYYNLTTTTPGQTVAFASTVNYFYGTITVGSTSGNKVTYSGARWLYMRNATSITPFVFNGTYNANPGYNINALNAVFQPSGDNIIPAGNYGPLYATSISGTKTMTMQGIVNVTGGIFAYGWPTCKGIIDTGGYTLTATGNLSLGSNGDITTYGKLITGNSTVTIGGDVTIYPSNGGGDNELIATGTPSISVGGNWANSDTFTAGTSTIQFTKTSGTQTLNSGGIGATQLFSNLTHSGAGTLQLLTNAVKVTGNFLNSGGTFTTTDGTSRDVTVDGNFTISSGTVTANASTITTGGNWDSSGGTFTRGTSIVKMTGTSKSITVPARV